MEVPFAVKAYSETLILNQQPLTLGAVLETDPSVRPSLGFGNASEQFVIRGFPLYGEDIAIDGLYGVTQRQLVSPELYDPDRPSVVWGKSVSARVDLGGRRITKNNN